MKLIDPSQRINVLWDSDDGTRYTEEMTIRKLLAVMSDDEVETIELVRCEECIHFDVFGRTTKYYGCKYYNMAVDADHFCKKGERRADDE